MQDVYAGIDILVLDTNKTVCSAEACARRIWLGKQNFFRKHDNSGVF